ncbi:MAG: hypothetical protein AMXMBFR26_06930 [Porticoccaceae bacterium]
MIDPATLAAGANFLGGAMSRGSSATGSPIGIGINFGSYGGLNSSGLLTGSASAPGAGGGVSPGVLMMAAGGVLLFMLLRRRGGR